MPARSYKDHLYERLQDQNEAAAYLNAALEDEDTHVFLMALRDIAVAQGGISHLSQETDLNRESLYRTLSTRGNPRLSSLKAVLGACGLAMSIQPAQSTKKLKRSR